MRRTDFNRRDGREVYCAGLLNQLGEHSHEGSNPSPFANGAVQQSGRCEAWQMPLRTPRKGENTVGSTPTRSPNLIGLACGVNRGQPQGAEGVGAYSNLAKPARFTSYLITFIILILVPVWGDFGLPGWVAWIGTITFFVGLRQSFIDYRHIVQNRYTVQQTRSAGVSLPHGRSPFSPAATLPASHTTGSLFSEAPFSTSEGK